MGFLERITVVILVTSVMACSAHVDPDFPPYLGHEKSSPDQLYVWAFDLDGDSLADFEIFYKTKQLMASPSHSEYHTIVALRPLGNNAIYAPNDCLVCPASAGQIIGNLGEWSNSEVYLSSSTLNSDVGWYSRWEGPWDGTKNNYLGIQIERNEDTYFGWLALVCSPLTGDVEIKDVYISDVIEKSVYAGVHRDVAWSN